MSEHFKDEFANVLLAANLYGRFARTKFRVSGNRQDPYRQGLVKTYARRFGLKVFVETGTFLGDMVEAVRHDFEKVYSIELDPRLYRAAKFRFRRFPNVWILYGDSAEVLPKLMERVHVPCLFWLDAHFLSPRLGSKQPPLERELQTISEHPVRGHVVLVDDARFLNDTAGFPAVETAHSLFPDSHFFVKDDVLRITPARYMMAQ